MSLGDTEAARRLGRHPRLAILGPLEARLQSFDLIVLGVGGDARLAQRRVLGRDPEVGEAPVMRL